MKYILLFTALLPFIGLSQAFVDFSASPLVVCAGEPVQFTDLSVPTGNPIQSWTWDFGDGNSSNIQNPSHIYTAANTYTVILTVHDGVQGVAKVKTAYITVNPLPVISFQTALVACSTPYTAAFNNILPSGANFSYNWDFGNGITGTGINPSNAVYTTPGAYTINLEVTNTTTSCSNDFDLTINVYEYSTTFTIPDDTFCINEAVLFNSTSTTGTNNWSWNFGNGSVSSAEDPSFSYSTAGTYTVNLIATNTVTGCSDSHSETLVVLPNPTPSFTADPLAGCAPLNVDFTNTSLETGTFNWTFGDGDSFAGQNPPTQIYNSNGVYDVSLSLTNNFGCTGTTTMNDLITVSPLVPNFTANVQEGCETLSVQFTDASIAPDPTNAPITSWLWDFGNGNTFNGQVPPAQLYDEGEYTVSLTVGTAGGCTETISTPQFIQVGIPPIVDFTVDHFLDCAKTDFEFTNNTTIGVPFDPADVEYAWDFGDNGTDVVEDPTYNYPIDTGYFDVQLIVTFRGCSDTLVKDSLVYINAPISVFSPAQTIFCNPTLPLVVSFTDNAILGESPDDIKMIYTWGDGNSTTLEDADLYDSDAGDTSHTYMALGSYTIEQVVYNYTTGCEDSTTVTIHISNIQAAFSPANDSLCQFGTMAFTDASVSSHPISSYSYSMGTGAVLTTQNPSYTYNSSGDFDIVQTVTNNVGCQSTSTFNDLHVLALPQAIISPSVLAGCSPLNVEFENSSTLVGNGVPLETFNWTMSDGSVISTNDQNVSPDYTFTNEGVFQTTLQVIDQFGCMSSVASVNTTLTRPDANFTVPLVVCNEQIFSTTNTSVDNVSNQWFVDGISVGTGVNFTGSHSDQGSATIYSEVHEIELIVTDVNGCKDSTSMNMTVSLPYADANYDLVGANVNANGEFTCPPVFAEFTDSSSSFGTISSWDWDFGDGKFSTQQNPENTYVFAGTYTASFEITDQYGCVDDTVFFEYLTIGGPYADLSWENIGTICNPLYEFQVANASNVSDIVWNLDDGSTVHSTTNFNHVYSSQGNYIPTVEIYDDAECMVPVVLPQIVIANDMLNAFYTQSASEAEVGDDIVFVDGSTGGVGGITNWNWNMTTAFFNNTNNADVHYYWEIPGIHTITLEVIDNAGCLDTFQTQIIITADLEVPNVFTANSDGVNDFFSIPYPVFKTFNVVILNRWGNVVHEANDQTGVILWDGRAQNGEFCADGVYFYKLEGTMWDDTFASETGFVTLWLGN